MECHRCQWNGKPAEVRQKHCPKCASLNPDIPLNNHGRNFVGYGEILNTRYEPRTVEAPFDEEEGVETVALKGISPEAAAVFCDFMHRFLTLSPREMRVVALRFDSLRGTDGIQTIADIGGAIGESRQEVKDIFCNIVSKIPQIIALFAGVSLTLRKSQKARLKECSAPIQGFLPLEWKD